METNSRRNFIRGMALKGATFCLPSVESFAAITSRKANQTLKTGAVILFQGDSITEGNRGRNAVPNHISFSSETGNKIRSRVCWFSGSFR